MRSNFATTFSVSFRSSEISSSSVLIPSVDFCKLSSRLPAFKTHNKLIWQGMACSAQFLLIYQRWKEIRSKETPSGQDQEAYTDRFLRSHLPCLGTAWGQCKPPDDGQGGKEGFQCHAYGSSLPWATRAVHMPAENVPSHRMGGRWLGERLDIESTANPNTAGQPGKQISKFIQNWTSIVIMFQWVGTAIVMTAGPLNSSSVHVNPTLTCGAICSSNPVCPWKFPCSTSLKWTWFKKDIICNLKLIPILFNLVSSRIHKAVIVI